MRNLHGYILWTIPKLTSNIPKAFKALSFSIRIIGNMILTASQLTQYRGLGYVAVSDFFDHREVSAMGLELARLQRDGLLRNVATDGDGQTPSKTVQNLQICPLSPQSEFFRALPFCPKVIMAVQSCLGDPIQQQLDQIFLKPAGSGAGISWHQDNSYFGIDDPTHGIGLWIALHNATVANGTMHVIPGIYREQLKHTHDGERNHHIRCYPNEEKAIPVELRAGSDPNSRWSRLEWADSDRSARQ